MKISLVSLKNCLGIKELEFKPSKVTLIQGDVGQGKSSILETIKKVFTNIGERPEFVHSDGDKAETFLVLDDGTNIKKYINKQGKVTTVNVEKNGMKPSAAETFLKNLVGEGQLNPISLIQKNDDELSELILSTIPIRVTKEDLQSWIEEIPLGIDLSKHGLQVCKEVEKYLYEKRRDINRDVETYKTEVKTLTEKLPLNYDPEEWRNVSQTEKYDEIKKAQEHNQKINQQQNLINSADIEIESLRSKCKAEIADAKEKYSKEKVDKESVINEKKKQIEELKKEIAIIEKEVENIDNNCKNETERITNTYKELAENKKKEVEEAKKFIEKNEPISIEPLEKEHKEIENMKSYIRMADDLNDKKKKLTEVEAIRNDLTKKLEKIRNKPSELLAEAKMPIEGISISDDGKILINNRPIKNLSGGERIKFAVNLAKATAGECKVILIDGFEALSPSKQEGFIKECMNDDFEYIITEVTDGLLRILNINEDGSIVDASTGKQLESTN